jgi:hypothetical protein
LREKIAGFRDESSKKSVRSLKHRPVLPFSEQFFCKKLSVRASKLYVNGTINTTSTFLLDNPADNGKVIKGAAQRGTQDDTKIQYNDKNT